MWAGWWWVACHSVQSMRLGSEELGKTLGGPVFLKQLKDMGLKGIKRSALVISRQKLEVRLWALVGWRDGR